MSDVSLQQIEAAKDAVSHPSHYTSGGIECKDAMAAMMVHDHLPRYWQQLLALESRLGTMKSKPLPEIAGA